LDFEKLKWLGAYSANPEWIQAFSLDVEKHCSTTAAETVRNSSAASAEVQFSSASSAASPLRRDSADKMNQIRLMSASGMRFAVSAEFQILEFIDFVTRLRRT
jgi:hypothetical protein